MTIEIKNIHPICELVPNMSNEEYELLRDGMKTAGFHPDNPVIVYKGYPYLFHQMEPASSN